MPCPHCQPVDNDVQIVLQFSKCSQAALFLSDLDNWMKDKAKKQATPPPPPPPMKNPNDRRGQHTKELHRRAREYQTQHPLIPYSECMRLSRFTV